MALESLLAVEATAGAGVGLEAIGLDRVGAGGAVEADLDRPGDATAELGDGAVALGLLDQLGVIGEVRHGAPAWSQAVRASRTIASAASPRAILASR